MKASLAIAAALFLATAAISYYKMSELGYSMALEDPEPGYYVRLVMTMTSKSSETPIRVSVTLPLENERQRITNPLFRDAGFERAVEYESDNRIARFRGEGLSGRQSISYSFRARTERRKFNLPVGLSLPESPDPAMSEYLQEEKYFEVNDPALRAKARELVDEVEGKKNTAEVVRALYDFVASGIDYKNYKGKTGALTALKLGQASCNGKNRLLVSLCRSLNLPARMAGGLVLKPKFREQSVTKKTTHSWTEIYIGDHWIPFCPTNGYYAEIPAHYLELYKGDRALITRTKNIDFDYRWKIRERAASREEALLNNAGNPANILSVWATLREAHISINLLVIILTVPIGATIVAFARNLIGLVPFGTFMPALIAVAFRDTGLAWGLLLFSTVILLAGLFWILLDRLGVLHVPRLAAMLTFSVMLIVGIALLAMKLGHREAAAISLFPMAILTLTSERFAITHLEEGTFETLRRFLVSLFLACACYGVMRSSWVENAVIAYPEILISVIGVNILIGSWTGLRLTELYRFRALYLNDDVEKEAV